MTLLAIKKKEILRYKFYVPKLCLHRRKVTTIYAICVQHAQENI